VTRDIIGVLWNRGNEIKEVIEMHMFRTVRVGLFLAAIASPIVAEPLIAADAPTTLAQLVGQIASSPAAAPATNPATPTADQLDAQAAKGPDDALKVGLIYRDGTDGVTQDYAKAMTYFTKAADGGNTKAMTDIGDLYLHGQGVAQEGDHGARLVGDGEDGRAIR
jgi:hypothetical protein